VRALAGRSSGLDLLQTSLFFLLSIVDNMIRFLKLAASRSQKRETEIETEQTIKIKIKI
jgi:hypothetical protein